MSRWLWLGINLCLVLFILVYTIRQMWLCERCGHFHKRQHDCQQERDREGME